MITKKKNLVQTRRKRSPNCGAKLRASSCKKSHCVLDACGSRAPWLTSERPCLPPPPRSPPTMIRVAGKRTVLLPFLCDRELLHAIRPTPPNEKQT